MSVHKIELEPFLGKGDRAQRYCVWHNGKVLIEDTWNPEYEACRALLSMNITGTLVTWRRGGGVPCMRLDIEKAARLTVEEGDKHGPRLVKWRPPYATAQNPWPSSAGDAQTGVRPNQGRTPRRPETPADGPAADAAWGTA